MRKDKNIKFNLHESHFIDYKIDDNTITFRVAVDCCINDIEENEDEHYLYDIICHNYELIDDYGVKENDLFFSEIGDLTVCDDGYALVLFPDNGIYVHFVFKATSIEWLPIIRISADDLYETDLVDGYVFNK